MSFIYASAKNMLLTGQLDLVDDQIVCVLVSSYYTVSYNHATLLDIPVSARIATSGTLPGRSVSAGGLKSNPVTVPSVTGDNIAALVLVKTSGTEATSPLVAFLNDSPDLPKNPDGSSIVLSWGTQAIFSI